MSTKTCKSVFQVNDGAYTFTYSCMLPEHGAEKLHVCNHTVIKDVAYGSGNKYREANTLHWTVEENQIKLIESIFPKDILTGEDHTSITGVASEKYPGTYGKKLRICINNVLNNWNDGTPPVYEKLYDYLNLLWRE